MELLWTATLVTLGVAGLWFAPRHWWGWAICSVSEVVWFAYAWWLGATALMVMSVVWFVVHFRNTLLTRRPAPVVASTLLEGLPSEYDAIVADAHRRRFYD